MRKKKVFLTLIASALFVSCLTSCNDENNGNNVNNSADNSSSVTQSVPSNNDSNTNQQSNSNSNTNQQSNSSSNTQTQDYNISDNETSKKVFDELAKIYSDITYEDFLKNGTFDDKGIKSEFKYKSMTIDINPDGTFYYLTKYTYDDNNELLYEEAKYINDSWVLTIKKEYFENSNVVKVEKQYRFDSNGVYTNLQEISYDENGNTITRKNYKYINDSWIKVTESKNFGSDGLEPIYILVLNDDGTYNTLEESTYDENNIITTTKSKYINDSWVKIQERKWKKNADGSSEKDELTYFVTYNEDGSFKSSVELIIDDNFNVLTNIHSVYSEGEWIYEFKTEYTYDADGNEVAVTSYDYVDNKWDKTYEYIIINGEDYVTYNKKSIYGLFEAAYDEKGNRLTEIYSNYYNGEWVYYSKYEYTYDESGNKLTRIYSDYYDTKWSYTSKCEYTYDEKGNRLTEIYSNYYNGEWVYYSKYEYTYDESGNTLTQKNSNYENGEWVYTSKYEYTYDTDGNKVAEIRYNYVDNKWDKTKESILINGSFYDAYTKNDFYIYEYTYDENANILTTDISIKIDDNWVKYQSSKLINGKTKTIYWLHIIYENEFDYSDEYEYDEQANIKTHIVFRYKDNKINSGSKYEYEYDERNNETLEIYYSYKNGEWIPRTKQEYEYNEGNHKTLFVRSEYKDGEWVYNYKIEYIFDQYGNQTGTLTYVYENGEWVKQ